MKKVISIMTPTLMAQFENIAGILNSNKNILGMMPHPERMVDKIISNEVWTNLFSSLLK